MKKLYTTSTILFFFLSQSLNAQNVGIGISTPQEKLHVNGSVRGDQSGALRIQTPTGYTDIGSKNASWSHFYTDRATYYFDKGIVLGIGELGSYTGQALTLRADYSASASANQLRLLTNGNVGIGISSPSAALHIYRPDTEVAEVYATGSSQGSGYFFAGQSLSHGGGFAYDGDGSPDIVGGTDRITFFRRTVSADYDVMSYAHNSDEVRMTNLAGSGTVLLQADNDGDIQKKAYSGSSADVLTGAGTWVNLASAVSGDNLGNHTATQNVNASWFELQNVRGIQGKDWDDQTGGTDSKYRILFRDGAHQFYNGGVVVGNYNNDTWTDLADGTLIVENNLGVATTAVRADTKLDVDGAIGTSRMGIGGTYNSAEVQGIWSIAPNYKISTASNDFGTQYGIVYAHTNAGTGTTKQPIAGWGHQIMFTSNGTRNISLSLSNGHAYFLGNVGIGITSPSYKLHVVGKIKSDGINETSDIRLKENINSITDALDKVMMMRGVTYNWKNNVIEGSNFSDRLQIGVIAQEIEKIIPEVVSTDNEGYKSVEYSHIVPMLIEAIKEQQKKIDILNARADEQNKQLIEIKASLNQTAGPDLNNVSLK